MLLASGCDSAAPRTTEAPPSVAQPSASPSMLSRWRPESAQLELLMLQERELVSLLTWASRQPGGQPGTVATASGVAAPKLSEAGRAVARRRRLEAPPPTALGIASAEALARAAAAISVASGAPTGLAWRTGRLDLGREGARVELLWATDAEGDAVYGLATRLGAAGGTQVRLSATLMPDGGEKLELEAPNHGWEGSPTLRSSWTRLLTASGTVVGAGVFSLVSLDGVVRTLPVSFAGTAARWTATVRDPGVKVPLSVSLTPHADANEP